MSVLLAMAAPSPAFSVLLTVTRLILSESHAALDGPSRLHEYSLILTRLPSRLHEDSLVLDSGARAGNVPSLPFL